jgi:sigma-B regulation protein RsbU (phosphoserine phosphatase)
MFVTALYMVYDARTGEVSLANAGQPQPLLDGAPVAIKGLPLGASARTSYKEASLVLAPGQTLAAYSDGLEDLEDEAGAQYGPERVQAYFQHAAALAPAEVMADLRARLATFAGKAPPADDLTVAILQRGPLELARTVPAAEVPERAG